MNESSTQTQAVESQPDVRLDSWKEIAAYLNRDITTVQRWEKREGMPVHRHLHAKRGSVYALSEELDAWQRGRGVAPAAPDQRLGVEALVSGQPTRADGVWKHMGWMWFAAAGILLLLAVGYATLRHRPSSPAVAVIRSVAVLPLRNLSGDPSQDYLADGVTEALIGRLAGLKNLRVISHTSVMRFKNTQATVPEIARTLGVDAVVEGSVIRSGTRIQVTAQLIRGSSDEHFWSETYNREMRDVLSMEGEIADAVAQKVEITVDGPERQRLTAARKVAPEVYESYLKGLYAREERNGRPGYEESLKDFEAAIRLDPYFAPAYLGIAKSYASLGTVFAGVSPAETRPKELAAVRKALELDPDLAEAHLELARVLQREWKWEEAEREYLRALELAPNDAGAEVAYADWLACEGRTDQAVARVRLARDLDPWKVDGTYVSWELFLAHRYPEAIRESHSALAVRSDDSYGLFTLGFALTANKQAGDAVPVLEKALSLSSGSPAVEAVLVRAYAHAGRRPDAFRLLQDLQRRQRTGYIPAAAFVNAYLGLGDNKSAFIALQQAYNEKSTILQFVKVHPFFDPIRDDPRFQKLVAEVGLGK